MTSSSFGSTTQEVPVADTFAAILSTPLPGRLRLGLRMTEIGVSGIDFLDSRTPLRAPEGGLAQTVAKQLDGYFSDPCRAPDFPLDLQGTPFQRGVWDALSTLPAGVVRRYGELAASLESSPRAVAGACRANPVPLVVPCHRVVSGAGIGGYCGQRGGWAVAVKEWLLRHEGVL